ncbi:DUF4148 domain-containing protein [Paraburkholderia antibiotica]|uniref:DUF4148 domain-containing protein n=1 Tax=Paraburkholderia antibiotica TaxID=2728839 RepID=A0A7Y0FGI1_9BURK|nr:DUF4148 domain-containing protein [Paraburkholderia antibiotica]NML35045.1 DUF4148 domain-containing protein [Paraburkholderia antibiotica]
MAVCTGLVVGAVALGAYVSQSEGGWLSADEISRIEAASIRANAASGRIGSLDETMPDDQALRRSALRNDLNAISPLQPGEGVDTRLPQIQPGDARPAPQTTSQPSPPTTKPKRTQTAKSAHSRESRAVLRAQVRSAAVLAKKPRSAQTVGAVSGGTSGGTSGSSSGSIFGVDRAWLLNSRGLHSVEAGNAPKTRAQVRAELARAREDGSMPAFGNPNPMGPAGAPNQRFAERP